MPRVAAIASAPKMTMARPLIAPKPVQARSVTAPAGQKPRPANCSAPKVAELKPTIEPMLRSTTPASRAKPEKAPMIIGTATNMPMMVRLLAERKRGPTQISATAITTISVSAMLTTGLASQSRSGWWAMVTPAGAGQGLRGDGHRATRRAR